MRTARRSKDAVEIVSGLATGDAILINASQGQVARIEPVVSPADASLHAAADEEDESGLGARDSASSAANRSAE